jgi:hypothetical protein
MNMMNSKNIINNLILNFDFIKRLLNFNTTKSILYLKHEANEISFNKKIFYGKNFKW